MLPSFKFLLVEIGDLYGLRSSSHDVLFTSMEVRLQKVRIIVHKFLFTQFTYASKWNNGSIVITFGAKSATYVVSFR